MREFLSQDEDIQKAHPHSCYDLIANISHEGEPGLFYVLYLIYKIAYLQCTIMWSDYYTIYIILWLFYF